MVHWLGVDAAYGTRSLLGLPLQYIVDEGALSDHVHVLFSSWLELSVFVIAIQKWLTFCALISQDHWWRHVAG